MVSYGLLQHTEFSITTMSWILRISFCMIEHEDDPPLGEKRSFKLNGSNACIVDYKVLKAGSIAKMELPGRLEKYSLHVTKTKLVQHFVYLL